MKSTDKSWFTRTFDWRLVFAVAFLLLVSYLVWSGYQNALEVRESGRRSDVLISRLKAQEDASSRKDLADTAQRQILLQTQEELLQTYNHLERSQKRLLRWLHRHGIQVPFKLVQVQTTSSRAAQSGPKAHKPPTQPKVAPVPFPSFVAPGHKGGCTHGNSCNAPGHNKH